MTKEQEDSIEILKNTDISTIELAEITDLYTYSIAVKTVLSMLKEKDKEMEKKDNIIDLMAEYIFQNVDVEEDICNSAYVECTQETAQDITCISCIRQYFEREVNSSEQ